MRERREFAIEGELLLFCWVVFMFPPFPSERFSIVYADPPWDYKGQLQHTGAGGRDSGGAVRHYPTVKTKDLKNLPVWEIVEEDCLLFMWATSPHLDQAIDLGKAWGFEWGTIAFVWNKGKANPGFYTMSENEICLVFKRGKIPSPRGARNVRQTIFHPRSKHSRKPEEARHRIGLMFPEQRKIELFAREEVEGWTAWGIDVEEADVEDTRFVDGKTRGRPFVTKAAR